MIVSDHGGREFGKCSRRKRPGIFRCRFLRCRLMKRVHRAAKSTGSLLCRKSGKKKGRKRELSALNSGGEGGIRTPEALIRTCTLSRGVHSTSLPLLRRDPSERLLRSKQKKPGCRRINRSVGSSPPRLVSTERTKNSMIIEKKQKVFSPKRFARVRVGNAQKRKNRRFFSEPTASELVVR